MIKKITVVLLLFTAAAAGYITYTKLDEGPSPVVTQAVASAPSSNIIVDFTLPDLDGNAHNISDWHGKPRLINFWATWCAPCRREIPLLKKTQT